MKRWRSETIDTDIIESIVRDAIQQGKLWELYTSEFFRDWREYYGEDAMKDLVRKTIAKLAREEKKEKSNAPI
jgi:hypothetical protein